VRRRRARRALRAAPASADAGLDDVAPIDPHVPAGVARAVGVAPARDAAAPAQADVAPAPRLPPLGAAVVAEPPAAAWSIADECVTRGVSRRGGILHDARVGAVARAPARLVGDAAQHPLRNAAARAGARGPADAPVRAVGIAAARARADLRHAAARELEGGGLEAARPRRESLALRVERALLAGPAGRDAGAGLGIADGAGGERAVRVGAAVVGRQ